MATGRSPTATKDAPCRRDGPPMRRKRAAAGRGAARRAISAVVRQAAVVARKTERSPGQSMPSTPASADSSPAKSAAGRGPSPPSTWGPTPSAWSLPRCCPTAASRCWSGCSGRSAWAKTPSAAAGWAPPACGPPWPCLHDYQQLLRLYKVERMRAVATSAAREASNADTFLDRIFMATGLHVEVIGTSEESRLTVSAVRQAVGDALGVNQDEALIADVGGGSTLLTLLAGRRDRHFAEPAAGLHPPAGDVLHQRGLAAAFGRDAPLPHCQRAGRVAEFAAAAERAFLHRRGRRCPLRRPADRPSHRQRRPGDRRSVGVRQAGGALRAAHGGGAFQAARFALRRGRDAQSGPAWSTRICCG